MDRHLAGYAATVTAIDAAPEMIALARQRVTADNVTFVTADVLAWPPPRQFDTAFSPAGPPTCPAWCPAGSGRCCAPLASGGRVLIVDAQPAAAALETYVEQSREVGERWLSDGTRHRLIKVARDPAELTR